MNVNFRKQATTITLCPTRGASFSVGRCRFLPSHRAVSQARLAGHQRRYALVVLIPHGGNILVVNFEGSEVSVFFGAFYPMIVRGPRFCQITLLTAQHHDHPPRHLGCLNCYCASLGCLNPRVLPSPLYQRTVNGKIRKKACDWQNALNPVNFLGHVLSFNSNGGDRSRKKNSPASDRERSDGAKCDRENFRFPNECQTLPLNSTARQAANKLIN